MAKQYHRYVIFLLLSLVGASVAWADEDEDRKEKSFAAEIVRVADLSFHDQLGPFFGPNGNDPLRDGKLEVRGNRKVEVQLKGTVPSTVYNVFFCPFGLPPAGCLGLGTTTTNSEGNAKTSLPFAATQNTWAGAFIFTRNTPNPTSQFISGFQFAQNEGEAQGGVEVELEGKISSLNSSNQSFRLNNFPVDIFVGPDTRFKKVGGFGALLVGQKVEVKGFTRTDGTILATRVEAEHGDDDDR